MNQLPFLNSTIHKLFFCFALILSLSCKAETAQPKTVTELTASGFGQTAAHAQANALGEIVSQINTLIRFNRCALAVEGIEGDQLENKRHQDNSACDLDAFYFDYPLQEVSFTPLKTVPGEHGVYAELNAASVKTYFGSELQALQKSIDTNLKGSESEPVASMDEKDIWLSFQKARAYASLLELFGIEGSLTLSQAKRVFIESIPNRIAKNISNLKDIGTTLATLKGAKEAFIHAPMPLHSYEMTPFSLLVRDNIEAEFNRLFPSQKVRTRGLKKSKKSCSSAVHNIQTHCEPTQSSTVLSTHASGQAAPQSGKKKSQSSDSMSFIGSYEALDDELIISYKSIDAAKGLTDIRFFRAPLSVTQGKRFNPRNIAFEKHLQQNQLADPTFRTAISSNRGTRSILLEGGDIFELKIKLSQAGYFYLVGHIIHENEQYSYLVEMDPYNNSFVGRIGPGQANRWVSIGEFTIEPPYGVEHLQLVSANYNLSKSLPKTQWNEELGYYIITGSENNAEKAVATVRGFQRVCKSATTRGFQRSCQADIKVSKADKKPNNSGQKTKPAKLEHESVLTYTTLAKN